MENKTHGLMIMAGFLLGAITVGVLVKRPPKENIYFRCHECGSLVLPEEDLCPVCGSQVKRINNKGVKNGLQTHEGGCSAHREDD